ncbi:hypothetical protein AB4Y88_23290 [Paenarthrobacter sp. RAF9]
MARTLRKDLVLAASLLGLGLLLAFTGTVLMGQWLAAEHHHQQSSLDHLLGTSASIVGSSIATWWTASCFLAFLATAMQRRGRTKAARTISKFIVDPDIAQHAEGWRSSACRNRFGKGRGH